MHNVVHTPDVTCFGRIITYRYKDVPEVLGLFFCLDKLSDF
jgi:hypothetical protein